MDLHSALPTKDRPKTWFLLSFLLLSAAFATDAVFDLERRFAWTCALFILGAAWGLAWLGFCDLYRPTEPLVRYGTAVLLSGVLFGGNLWAAHGVGDWAGEVKLRSAECRDARSREAERIERDRPQDPGEGPWIDACGSLRFRAGFGHRPGWHEDSLLDELLLRSIAGLGSGR